MAEDVHSPMGGSDDVVSLAVQEYFINSGSVRQWLMGYDDRTMYIYWRSASFGRIPADGIDAMG